MRGGGGAPHCSERLETLENIVRKAVSTPMDIVTIDGYFHFLYTDDNRYLQYVPDGNKKKNMADLPQFPVTPDPARGVRYYESEFINDRPTHVNYLKLCLAHLWSEGQFCDVLDVGANVGMVSVCFADFIHASAQKGHVYSFEPGQSFALLEANIHLNHMADRITLENKAVGKTDSYTALALGLGHTEGGRIATQISRSMSEYIHRLAPLCRLDSYLADKPDNALVIKIDTEGRDADVIFGLSSVISRVRAMVFEYSLDQMRNRGENPLEALLWLQDNGFALFNCNSYPKGRDGGRVATVEALDAADRQSLDAFFRRVTDNHNWQQTDILAISKSVPGFDSLLDKLNEMCQNHKAA